MIDTYKKKKKKKNAATVIKIHDYTLQGRLRSIRMLPEEVYRGK